VWRSLYCRVWCWKNYENQSAFGEVTAKCVVPPFWLVFIGTCIKLFRKLAFSALTPSVGRQEEHLACRKLSDEVLAWLSVCSKVQMIYIWSIWCHCHPITSCFIKIQIGSTFLLPAYPGYPGKEVSVCLFRTHLSEKGLYGKSDNPVIISSTNHGQHRVYADVNQYAITELNYHYTI